MKSKKFVRVIQNILITLVVGLIYFYIELPAINLQDETFYYFFFILSATYCVASIITSGFWKNYTTNADLIKSVLQNFKVPVFACAALIVLLFVGTILSSPIIRAKDYSELLPFERGDFATDIDEVSFDTIPMLDKDSAQQLANRKLGELSDMVSQFEVSTENNQINYEGAPVRVVPLEYADLVRWFTNRGEGLPAYILIDMVTQKTELVRLDEGMRYTTTEHLMRNLERHLRFQYPTVMFDTPTFEIDEDGKPYWICPTIEKTIGLFGGVNVNGAVIVDAVSGESTFYNTQDVPQWVDRVFSAELIIEQYDYYGLYNNGFINSIFGRRDVTVTTAGYNYLAIDDDVYIYTGVTSIGSDQSNIGFLLANQRTKQTSFYSVAGAEEYSAMSSAQGAVQHLNYSATFPLLLNINGEPTYFMALKDAAGLVKMYAMVNVQQYQIVATGASVLECELAYEELLSQNNITTSQPQQENTMQGVISDIRHTVMGGESHYYISFNNAQDIYYVIKAADNKISVTLNVGDEIKIVYSEVDENNIFDAMSVEIIEKAPIQSALQENNTVQQEQQDDEIIDDEQETQNLDDE